MAKKIGVYDAETAKIILEVVNYLRVNGFVIPQAGRGGQFVPPEAPIYVRNDTGEEIPPFACLQTDGAVDVGGQNYIKVTKPVDDTGEAGGYLFNGIAPIESSGYGIAYAGPLVRMLTDGSAVNSGDKWQPDIGSFAVIPGGSRFTAAGEDDIQTNIMRAFTSSGGGGGATLQGTLSSIADGTGDYAGLKVGTVAVVIAPCDRPGLAGTNVEVVDWSECVFDLPIEDLSGVWVWAEEGINEGGECHWTASDRCCVAADSGA